MPTKNDRTWTLAALLQKVIDDDPYERDGFKWAARPQAYYAEKIGIETKTVRRYAAGPPFQRKVAQTKFGNVVLLCLGDPAPSDAKAVAKDLR